MVRSRLTIFLVLISLAALALRLFRLDHQSLWYDEAFSVYLAKMSLGDITARTAADIQPPLYYYLLHFWMGLGGQSEFAVRFLSVFFGVLSVPLLYAVASRTFGGMRTVSSATAMLWLPTKGRVEGIFAALLALFSPLYLWYSQEGRMYTLITFLGLLSSYLMLSALGATRRGKSASRLWLLFALTNIAAVYVHYFAFVIIAFQALYVIAVCLSRRDLNALGRALLSFLGIAVAFLPWLPFLVSRLGEDASYWRGALKIDEAFRHIFISFATGESVLESTAQNIAAAWLVVLVIGLIAWLLARRSGGASGKYVTGIGLSFSILYLVIPLSLLLFLFWRNPKFNARYLMIASPGLYLLLAVGLAGMWRLAKRSNLAVRSISGLFLIFACATLFGSSAYADSNAFYDPAFTKPDFRGVAQYISANAHDDEAIILDSGHMFPAFDYYYADARDPEIRLPDDPTLNAEHVLGYSTANDLNQALAGRRGAWLVQWQDEVVDPNGFLPMLLSTRGKEEQLNAAFWQIKLRHWSLPADAAPFSPQPEVANVRAANYKNKFKLLGWSAQHPTTADKGATFDLCWQSLDPITDDYNVSLRIVDAEGNLWGKLDRRPSGYNYPTTRWKKGELLFGEYTVPLLPGTPAGDYYATVTLFTAADPTGLDVLAPNGAPVGKSVKLGPIHVLPAASQPSVVDLKIQHTINARAEPFTLLGFALSREKASQGESIPLTLFWRADQASQSDLTFQVQFGDASSSVLPLANATYPTGRWRAGDIVRGQYLVQVPVEVNAGDYDLHLKLSDGQLLDLQQKFAIEKTDRVFAKPVAQFTQDANFNNLVALNGYDLSSEQVRPGDTLTVTLNWKASAKMDKAYTVFVHMLDSNSKVGPQMDRQPMNNTRPTTSWVEGEYLRDAYPMAVAANTSPGTYQIEIGWYDASDPSFARLQVIDSNGNGAGDRVVLNKTVTVVSGQ